MLHSAMMRCIDGLISIEHLIRSVFVMLGPLCLNRLSNLKREAYVMKLTSFHIPAMDCSSEEQMVRMRLEGVEGVHALEFDLPGRRLDIYHDTTPETLVRLLEPLNLGARQTAHKEGVLAPDGDHLATADRRPLMWALAINLTLFFGELTAGLVSGSMGLVADSLDMMADALVYALSLAAVGGSAARKNKLAASSGHLQLGLALFGLLEVVRRFIYAAETPDVGFMIVVSLVALAANVATLLVLRKTSRGEAHIEASWIFTSNDIKINALVIVAGVLVWWSSSQLPDLIAGGLIFLIVANGARRILALSRSSQG